MFSIISCCQAGESAHPSQQLKTYEKLLMGQEKKVEFACSSHVVALSDQDTNENWGMEQILVWVAYKTKLCPTVSPKPANTACKNPQTNTTCLIISSTSADSMPDAINSINHHLHQRFVKNFTGPNEETPYKSQSIS